MKQPGGKGTMIVCGRGIARAARQEGDSMLDPLT